MNANEKLIAAIRHFEQKGRAAELAKAEVDSAECEVVRVIAARGATGQKIFLDGKFYQSDDHGRLIWTSFDGLFLGCPTQ
jgi:hypothetical protein